MEVARLLLAVTFWALGAGTTPAQPAEPPTGPVVFVCEHGSVGMKAEGLKGDQRFTPTRFSASDLQDASRVVVFDVPMPSADQIQRWDGLPAFSDGYAAASLAIRQRIEELLRSMTDK